MTVVAKILDRSEGNVLGFRLQGQVNVGDVVVVFPELERLIEEFGSARVLVVLEDVVGITPAAVWEELKFEARHFRDVERVAVVGEKSWEKALALLAKPFVSGEVKFFPSTQLEQAWSWIKL